MRSWIFNIIILLSELSQAVPIPSAKPFLPGPSLGTPPALKLSSAPPRRDCRPTLFADDLPRVTFARGEPTRDDGAKSASEEFAADDNADTCTRGLEVRLASMMEMIDRKDFDNADHIGLGVLSLMRMGSLDCAHYEPLFLSCLKKIENRRRAIQGQSSDLDADTIESAMFWNLVGKSAGERMRRSWCVFEMTDMATRSVAPELAWNCVQASDSDLEYVVPVLLRCAAETGWLSISVSSRLLHDGFVSYEEARDAYKLRLREIRRGEVLHDEVEDETIELQKRIRMAEQMIVYRD